jgi:hypothetical protein
MITLPKVVSRSAKQNFKKTRNSRKQEIQEDKKFKFYAI